MSYAPVVPTGGYTGWKFLQRTMDSQREAFLASPIQRRDEDHFREKIGTVNSADDLIRDRRLLSFALGAFGLQNDINNTYFIHKVLADGTLDTGDLANKLADKRYLEFAKAFGFGDYDAPRTLLSDFAERMIAQHRSRQFEVAVGAQNDDLRLAMNAERELGQIAGKASSEDTKWFSILGSAPLRQVFQTALGLPSSIAGIDLDQQVTAFREKSERYLGTSKVADFSEPGPMDNLVRLFLLRSDANAVRAATGAGAAALTLLQNSSTNARANIFALLG